MFNPFTCEWEPGDFGIRDGIVLGQGPYRGARELDLKGKEVVPGLIDSHVHIESSLLCPAEYARLVSRHGTSAIIADPHEIANVLGVQGISYMLESSSSAEIDMFFMLPSCVPSTPGDKGGAVLLARDLAGLAGNARILGLGEVMNVPGVLSLDPELREKIDMFGIVDGHAPLLSGLDLNAYILAGPRSDHECTAPGEAREKLSKGMYLYLREGSTEKNIHALVPAVTSCNAPRCSFATDDRHADTLFTMGHIDDLIRKSVSEGLELETALRMATLSPAERFGLHDRGALAPGRVADFSVVDTRDGFKVLQTFRRGQRAGERLYTRPRPAPSLMDATMPSLADISPDMGGTTRVIGIVPGQILTKEMHFSISPGMIPDPGQDIIKATVCSRYQPRRNATALVHGFGFSGGAIAGSVSHDAHNVIAAGTSDRELLHAIELVIRNKGGLAAVCGENVAFLPLESAGLMSVLSYEDVVEKLSLLRSVTETMGGIEDPFMYLSFLCLPVIPQLRLTVQGLFSVQSFSPVPLNVDEH